MSPDLLIDHYSWRKDWRDDSSKHPYFRECERSEWDICWTNKRMKVWYDEIAIRLTSRTMILQRRTLLSDDIDCGQKYTKGSVRKDNKGSLKSAPQWDRILFVTSNIAWKRTIAKIEGRVVTISQNDCRHHFLNSCPSYILWCEAPTLWTSTRFRLATNLQIVRRRDASSQSGHRCIFAEEKGTLRAAQEHIGYIATLGVWKRDRTVGRDSLYLTAIEGSVSMEALNVYRRADARGLTSAVN